MRLTTTHREAFVRAALDDVPQIDYDEQINKLVQDHFDKLCPPELFKFFRNEKTAGYFNSAHVKVHNWECRYFNLVPYEDYVLPSGLQEKVNVLFTAKSEQHKTNRSLKEKLEGAIAAFTTRKAAAEALPEFEKYLPAEESPINKSVPMVANLVADLTAAGWPKDKKSTKGKK